MDLDNEIIAACDKLAMWYEEGRVIPGYIFKRGRTFLSKLIGIRTATTQSDFRRVYHASGSQLVQLINQPDGWIYLQIAIAKAKEKESEQTAKS